MFQPGYQQPQGYYPPPQRMIQQPGLKGYPVSSLEEARAAVVDFDGTLFFFPDIVNKRIYTKQINVDGTATLNMYELTAIPTPPPAESMYVTKDDFNNAIGELKNLFLNLGGQQQGQKPVF